MKQLLLYPDGCVGNQQVRSASSPSARNDKSNHDKTLFDRNVYSSFLSSSRLIWYKGHQSCNNFFQRIYNSDLNNRGSREKAVGRTRRNRSWCFSPCPRPTRRQPAGTLARVEEYIRRSRSQPRTAGLSIGPGTPGQHADRPRNVVWRLGSHVTHGRRRRRRHRPRSLPVSGSSSRDDVRIRGYARPDCCRTSHLPASRAKFWVNWE
jgi:hypothetical protein